MNVQQCFEEGLLKDGLPDKEKAIRSVEKAEEKITLASEELNAGFSESAVLTAYTAMFHASRAILFKDGVKERSHYAIYVYLKEKYFDRIEARFLNELNNLRLERHDIMYGLEKPKDMLKEEAQSIIATVSDFIGVIEELVK